MSYHQSGQLAGPNGDPIPGAPTPVSGLKGQPVRLWDVFVLGPAMLYGGWRLYQTGQRADRGIAGFLGLAGVLTIAFNGVNFWRIEQAGTTERPPAPLGW
jgi:hypothetical protein